MPYDAFISYSHAADGRLAPALQSGLQNLARPWYRRAALRVFRDDTGLSVSSALWSSVAGALDESTYFVLLASPESAASPWVNREIEYWLERRTPETILPVLTAGDLVWDADRGTYNSTLSTALSSALVSCFSEEPRHLDMRWAHEDVHLDLRHSRFRDAVADLAAAIHQLPKDELEAEDLRRHRTTVRLVRATVVTLVALVLVALLSAGVAVGNARRAQANARRARQEAAVAESRFLATQSEDASGSQPDLALLLALEANRLNDNAESQQAIARSLQVSGLPDNTAPYPVSDPTNLNLAIALSNDSRVMAVGNARGGVSLIDPFTRRSVAASIRMGRGYLENAAFDASGSLLAIADNSGRILVHDLANPGHGGRYVGDGRSPYTASLAFSSGDRWLIGVTASGTATVWPVAQSRDDLGRAVTGADGGPVQVAAWSPHADLVAIATQRFVTVRSWPSGAVAATLPVAPPQVGTSTSSVALSFSPDGRLLAVEEAGSVEMFDATAGFRVDDVLSGLPTSGGSDGLTFSPNGTTLVAGSWRTLVAWDLVTRQPETITGLGTGGSFPLGVTAGGTILAAYVDRAADLIDVGVWNHGFASPFETLLPAGSGSVAGIYSPDGTQLVVGDTAGRAQLWKTAPLTPIGPELTFPKGVYLHFVWSPDGRTVAAARTDGTALLIDATTRHMRWLTGHTGDVWNLAFSADSRLLAGAGQDGTAIVWDLSTGTRTGRPLRGVGGAVYGVAFSRNGRLALAADDGVTVYDTRTWRQISTNDAISAKVAFTPDGRMVAVGLQSGDTEFIDALTGRQIGRTLVGPAVTVSGVAFSPDGRTLAVTGGDSSWLFDVSSESASAVLSPNLGPLHEPVFSSDGRKLMEGGSLGFVAQWSIDPNVWTVDACQLAHRNLTREEFAHYLPGIRYHRTCPSRPEPTS